MDLRRWLRGRPKPAEPSLRNSTEAVTPGTAGHLPGGGVLPSVPVTASHMARPSRPDLL